MSDGRWVIDWHSLAVASASAPQSSDMAMTPVWRNRGLDSLSSPDVLSIGIANSDFDEVRISGPRWGVPGSHNEPRHSPRLNAIQCTPEFLQQATGFLQARRSEPEAESLAACSFRGAQTNPPCGCAPSKR